MRIKSDPITTVQPLAPRVVRRTGAAQYLGVSVKLLEVMAMKGEGPRVLRLGRRAVGYDVRELDRFVEALGTR